MREILTVCKFRFKLINSDRILLTVLVLLPVLFILVLGGIQGFERQNLVPVAVVDLDQTDFSQRLVERFSAKDGLRIIKTNEQDARAMVAGFQVEACFIIHKGFKQGLLNEQPDNLITLVKSPNSLVSGILQETLAGDAARLAANSAAANMVQQEYRTYGLHLNNPQPDLWNSVWSYTDSLWEPEPPMKLEYREATGTGAKVIEGRPVPVTSAISTGMLVMFLMLLVMFYSSWLIEEKNSGTIKRIVLVPRLLAKIFLANILSLCLLAFLQVFLAWGVVRLVFGVNLIGSGLQFAVIAAYIFAAISMSLLLAASFRTPAQLQSAAPLVALLTGLIGGCFWSFIDLPGNFRYLSLLTPQGWALDSLLGQMRGDYPVQKTFVTIAVLCLFACIVSGVSYFLSKQATKT